MKNIIIMCSALMMFSSKGFTQESSPWSNESEVSIVQVSGNTKSESYSAKQKTVYKADANLFTTSARYLSAKSLDEETARQWEVSQRYERELGEKWAAFIQHGAESDPYSGYIQRDNSDLGGKYYFIKGELENLFSEVGFRTTKTILSSNKLSYNNSMRLYLEHAKSFSESVYGKLWVEYLPDLKESDAYLLSYEPSLSVMMGQIFSIKLGYLVKYKNIIASASEKKQDAIFTTTLVAKF